MKHLLTILLLAVAVCGNGQNDSTFVRKISTSRFERDGKIWISYDPPNAQTQRFFPLEQIYQCEGMFSKIITDTVCTKGVYRISFGKEWVEVREQKIISSYGLQPEPFSQHIMFSVMAACFDKKEVYCQCGEKFPIINKNF